MSRTTAPSRLWVGPIRREGVAGRCSTNVRRRVVTRRDPMTDNPAAARLLDSIMQRPSLRLHPWVTSVPEVQGGADLPRLNLKGRADHVAGTRRGWGKGRGHGLAPLGGKALAPQAEPAGLTARVAPSGSVLTGPAGGGQRHAVALPAREGSWLHRKRHNWALNSMRTMLRRPTAGWRCAAVVASGQRGRRVSGMRPSMSGPTAPVGG